MKKGKTFLRYAVGIIFSLIYIMPIWMVVVNSFKEKKEANLMGLGLPKTFTLDNYIQIFEGGGIVRAFFNGLIQAGSSTFIVLIVGSLAAFVIARSRNKIISNLYYVFLLGLVVPIAYIPTYLVLDILGLMNTHFGYVCVHATYGLPLAIFLYTAAVKGIPRELDEAAMIDGSSCWYLYRKIIFPLLRTTTATLFIFNFMGVWNDAQLPLFLLSGDKWALPLTINSFYGAHGQEWNLIFADIVITILPIAVVYIFDQKHIMAGMTAGAVKG